MRVAVPCEAPGGMNAAVSPHFGRCEAFTVIDVDREPAQLVAVLPNAAHARGGCMTPVMLLKQAGVDVLVASGMGMRPLLGFQREGIAVCSSENARSVTEAVRLVRAGQARRFEAGDVCDRHQAGGCH